MVYFFIPPVQFKVCSYILFFLIKVLFPSGAKVVIERYSWGLDIVIKTPRAYDANQEGGLCAYPGPYGGYIYEAGFKERYDKRTSINIIPVLSFLFRFSSLDSVIKQIYRVSYLVFHLVPFGSHNWKLNECHISSALIRIPLSDRYTKYISGVLKLNISLVNLNKYWLPRHLGTLPTLSVGTLSIFLAYSN